MAKNLALKIKKNGKRSVDSADRLVDYKTSRRPKNKVTIDPGPDPSLTPSEAVIESVEASRNEAVSTNDSAHTQAKPGERPANITARGTVRVRRHYRTRVEIGGDPRKEENQREVKIGGRVPPELRAEFLKITKALGITQGAALTQALEAYVLENKSK